MHLIELAQYCEGNPLAQYYEGNPLALDVFLL